MNLTMLRFEFYHFVLISYTTELLVMSTDHDRLIVCKPKRTKMT